MTKPMNYDKWKKIEVSDDEDDTHPNIDTPSLFRWRHQARIERRDQRLEDQTEHEKQSKEYEGNSSDSSFLSKHFLDFLVVDKNSTKN
jgi:hypothetical protein